MIILCNQNITIGEKNNPCEISVKIRKKFNQLDKSKKKKKEKIRNIIKYFNEENTKKKHDLKCRSQRTDRRRIRRIGMNSTSQEYNTTFIPISLFPLISTMNRLINL